MKIQTLVICCLQYRIVLEYYKRLIIKDYVVMGPIGRGAGSFVIKVQSRKSLKNYVKINRKNYKKGS